MKQDDAGCYHSAPTMLRIHQIAKTNSVALARINFSELRRGKDACDRKAATIKNHMKWRCSGCNSRIMRKTVYIKLQDDEMGWCQLHQQHRIQR
jgi:hypothetical protein